MIAMKKTVEGSYLIENVGDPKSEINRLLKVV